VTAQIDANQIARLRQRSVREEFRPASSVARQAVNEHAGRAGRCIGCVGRTAHAIVNRDLVDAELSFYVAQTGDTQDWQGEINVSSPAARDFQSYSARQRSQFVSQE
jgi:hypothetical protein